MNLTRHIIGALLGLSFPFALAAAFFYGAPWALFLWVVATIAWCVTSGKEQAR